MKFKEWLRIDEATPGARQTGGNAINLAVPTHYSTYGGSSEIDFYSRTNPFLTAAAHVARGGIGREASDLAQRSGLRIASAIGMDPLRLGDKAEKALTLGLPIQTNEIMADGSPSNFAKLGDTKLKLWREILSKMGENPDPVFVKAIVQIEDKGTKSPDKFGSADYKDQRSYEHAKLFTSLLLQVMAYKKMTEEPKNHEIYDLSNMKIKNLHDEDGVLWSTFVAPRKK